MSKTTHNTQAHNTETPRDLTVAELDLIVGGWCWILGVNPQTVHCSNTGGCSPFVNGPHCPGYR